MEIKEAENKKAEEEKKEILQAINNNVAKAKNSCIGIAKDLKTIQVLAGVSTGASAVGTLTSGGALASGIVKAGKDKKIYDTDIESKYKRLEEVKSLLETKDEKMAIYNTYLYGDKRSILNREKGGLLYDLEQEKEDEKTRKNNFESEYENYLSEIKYYAELRQKAIKEVPQLYKQYNTKQIELNKCLDELSNNEKYKKLIEREEEFYNIADQRFKERNQNNKIYIETKINLVTELNEEEKKEWQDMQVEKLNMNCDNLRYERDDIEYQINDLDDNYLNAATTLRSYGFRIGSKNAEHNIKNSSLLYEIKQNNFEFEKEVFTDVKSYMKQYRETGDKLNVYDTDTHTQLKHYKWLYEKKGIDIELVQEEIDDIMAKIKEFNDLEKEKELLEKEISEYKENEAVSNLTGNLRTGLMAGSIATSATSTITSGISAKKLDDLIEKMKDCDRSVTTLKSSVNNAVAEEIDTDLTTYQNIVKSCSGFDTNNIKDIKGVMVASAVVGGVGAMAGTVGTITSAVANNKKTKENAKNTEEGKVKAKALNITANISAGIATGTSASGIVLGAMTLNKLAKNVDVAEKCEDSLK